MFGSVRYLTTMGTKYLEKAAGKLGRLSCKNMAILGTCSMSSARTVGSEQQQNTHNKHDRLLTCNHVQIHYCKQSYVQTLLSNHAKKLIKGQINLPPSSDILATVSMTLIKSFSLSLNSRSTSSRPRATICLQSRRASD